MTSFKMAAFLNAILGIYENIETVKKRYKLEIFDAGHV